MTYMKLVAEDPVMVHSPSAPLPSGASSRPINFGRCSAYPSARTLLLDGHPVDLGARAFDLLMVLLSSRGQVVAKETIIGYVWPTTIVDDSNLRFQMTVLRKALGADRNLIKTISGRGYMVAEDALEGTCSDPSPKADDALNEGSSSRQLCDVLRLMIRALERQPSALRSVEALLAGSGFALTRETPCSDAPA